MIEVLEGRIFRTWNEPTGEVELSGKRTDKARCGVATPLLKEHDY
jgi:hypothetical protein